MRSVIERHSHHNDGQGFIHYDDRPSTYEHAEQIAGRRLDRRRSYAIIDGQVCDLATWTDDCSGCTEIGDYGMRYGPNGCKECGYTGKRRHAQWIPITNTRTEP